jgi:hypothetical protein
MEDKDLPKSYGEKSPPPVSFPEEDELCRRLDSFYQASGVQLSIPPSHLFKGALYAMRYKDNPDWIAQVAHSLREILYHFKGKGGWRKAILLYGSAYDRNRIGQDVGEYYNFIQVLAHHRFETAAISPLIGGSKMKPTVITTDIFENIVLRFGRVLSVVLQRQLEVHKEIDSILAQGPL